MTKRGGSSGASWPDRTRLHAFLKFMAMFYIVFFPIYFGAGYISEMSGRTSEMHFAWERDIPLVPVMIWPYLSVIPIFLLPLFHMSAQQLAVLSKQSTMASIIAGLFFLAIPGKLGFPVHDVEGIHTPIFALIRTLDTPYNLVPSLHVTFAVLMLSGSADLAPRSLAYLYRFWIVVLAASTVLVHQHHIFDVVAGFLLAVIVRTIAPLTAKSADA